MSELYIGLMSGTSSDGIDAVMVDFSDNKINVVETHYSPYSSSLRERILALCQTGENEIQRLGELDNFLGKEFADAVNHLLKKASLHSNEIKAIGSHGQTIRHSPAKFSLQIGDPNTIATLTGITTIADFRRKDIAIGGQGAPLVPAFHQTIFSSAHRHRAIVNIGGIANITLLQKNNEKEIIGFDTGPGNTLMDAWIYEHKQERFDKDGHWAATGQTHNSLLTELLNDFYFSALAPKSTGREYFNLSWVEANLKKMNTVIEPINIQTTLMELTVQSILSSIKKYIADGDILVCGGGAHNKYLMKRLTECAPEFSVDSTKDHGVDPDWVEAIAFAWLAKQTLNKKPGNVPSVTGAKRCAILGGVYYPQ